MTTPFFSGIAWMQTFSDYCSIFNLSPADLEVKILEFPAGVSTFNAQMTALGKSVVSANSLYAMSPESLDSYLASEIRDTQKQASTGLGERKIDLASHIKQVTKAQRIASIFTKDFGPGRRDGRYVFAGDHSLPFSDDAFDLAICQLSAAHANDALEIIEELSRVACNLRVVFALGKPDQVPEWFAPLMAHLEANHWRMSFHAIPSDAAGKHWVRLESRQMACHASRACA